MANEAVIIELLGNGGDPIRYNCADGTTIEKGTLLQLTSDPRTVSAVNGNGDLFVGIAAHEKVANDGSTTISVYTNGIFDIKTSAAGATLGLPLRTAGANLITTAQAGDGELGKMFGKALETAAANEVIAVRVLV